MDHVHINLFVSAVLCDIRGRGEATELRSRTVFKKFPKVKHELCGGEFWEGGYFARTLGDKVTAEGIRQHIRRHKEEIDSQLNMF